MACSQTLAGLASDCAASMGGIVEVYFANKADISAIEADTTTHKIDTITMASTAKFKKYAFPRNTGSMVSNWQFSAENGTKYVATDLQLVFNRMETTKRVEISALVQGEMVAMVRDANGTLWYLGFDEPLTPTAGDGNTGTARADRNGYSITLQDNSKDLPYEILEGTGGVDLSTIVG